MLWKRISSRLLGAWLWLTQAPGGLPVVARRQARLVAGVGLSLLLLLLTAGVVLLFLGPMLGSRGTQEAFIFLGSTLFVLASLYVNRRGRRRVAAGLLLSVTSAVTWVVVLVNRGSANETANLFYPLLTNILCGLLL